MNWINVKDRHFAQITESYTVDQLKHAIIKKEYQLEEIEEHGLGDSCTALTKFTVENELKIIKKELSCR